MRSRDRKLSVVLLVAALIIGPAAYFDLVGDWGRILFSVLLVAGFLTSVREWVEAKR